MASRDIEDVLNVVDGRQDLVAEIADASEELRSYISEEINQLINHRDLQYAVQSVAQNQAGRDEIIFQRLEALASS